jgi:hypothetical protein
MKKIVLSSCCFLFLQLNIQGQTNPIVTDVKPINDSLVNVTNNLGQTITLNLKKIVLPNISGVIPALPIIPITNTVTATVKEVTPTAPIYDPLSLILNSDGTSIVWDLQNITFANYTALELDLDRVPLIKPEILIKNNPILNINYSLTDTIQIQYLSHYAKLGTFTAKYLARGTLKLPNGETYLNARKIKVTENYKLIDLNDSRFCFTNKNTYTYFFASNNDTCATFCFSEKIKDNCMPSFIEYYKEISRPQLKLTNSLASTASLESIINLKITPNPAHDQTTISYYLPESGNITLSILNLTNNVSTIIESSSKITGQQQKIFSLSGILPNRYYIRLDYKGNVFQKQLLVN